MNVYRELVILTHLQNVVGMGMELPGIAQQYDELECVEPQPPGTLPELKDPEIPKKKKGPCLLGEKGISGNVVVFSFELSCDHVKISGGEGLLVSVNRDFRTHKTTFWGGAGVQGKYLQSNFTAEAKVGVEVTIEGDVAKDVTLTSSVKAGLSGVAEVEANARWAVEEGPSIEAGGGFITPSFPVIGN
jgi:hypothetical protein